MNYETILTEIRGDGPRRVGLITLNRPKQMNALNDQLMDELGQALLAFDADEGVGCIVVTGNEKAFAAGADIGAMKDYDFDRVYRNDYISRNWETLRRVRKPVIAAVAGVALGGGCEVALLCDIVIAADNARFGQPEITIGVIPGAVSPFAILNDIGRRVRVVLDRELLEADVLNFHPLDNAMTTTVSPEDFVRFLEAELHPPNIIRID